MAKVCCHCLSIFIPMFPVHLPLPHRPHYPHLFSPLRRNLGVLTLLCLPSLLAVVPDGYGLSYSIGDHYIRWTITSLKRRTQDLKRYLEEAALETRDMMERAAKAEQKAKL